MYSLVFVTSCRQYLHAETSGEALVISNVEIESKGEQNSSTAVLVLTEAAMFLFNKNKNMITSAFPLNEIEAETDKNRKNIRIIKKYPRIRKQRSVALDENPNYRQFFESFQKASESIQNEVECENMTENSAISLTLEPYIFELFTSIFHANKILLEDSVPLSEEDIGL